MKTSWVLSKDERNRRFNKVTMKSSNKTKPLQMKNVSPARLSELYMVFTQEEQNVLQDIQTRFTRTYCSKDWVRNLLDLNRDAGMNLIESAYELQPARYETWSWMQQSWGIAFYQHLMPYLTKGYNISSRDFTQLINGSNLFVAHTFKSSLIMRMKKKEQKPLCPMAGQVTQRNISKHESIFLKLIL